MAREESFTAEVKLAGINPYVDVPEHIVKVFGRASKTAVLVKIAATDPVKMKASARLVNHRFEKDAARLRTIGRLASGDWFRTTLVPARQNPTRLYLDRWMRETAGVGVGDSVRVTLTLDHRSREIPIPDRLREMLAVNPKARSAWEALRPSRRREILTYLNFLKTPEALERNIHRTIANLLKQPERNKGSEY